MECEKIVETTVTAGDLKQDTTLEQELEGALSSSSADDTPPGMIIVGSRISARQELMEPSVADKDTKIEGENEFGKDFQKDVELPREPENACSMSLGFKPRVQFQRVPHESVGRLLASTEAALAAATSSAYATPMSTIAEPFATLRHVVDEATQCNNLGNEVSASSESMSSLGSLVCRICHNGDNPEQLVSPCLCKGSLTYVHVQCLERWISTSHCTLCELCQFQYNTEQTLRYSCLQSLRIWYSRAMSRRALQEDCQMFSLLTLVAFGIIGTLLVGIQYYAMNNQSWAMSKLWTKSWMLFFLFMTVTVYFANIFMLVKSQVTPWYRWWQSARDIKLILENRRPFPNPSRLRHQAMDAGSLSASMITHHDQQELAPPTAVTPVPTTSSEDGIESSPGRQWGKRMESAMLAAAIAATVESIADASARESESKAVQQPSQEHHRPGQPSEGAGN
ncbi:E3 ubiquitin-protein ligase MARCH4 isoform X1 [Drosophila persimilis]|uniref:E3 ubiquitin-protein ligase MARCH4 isoform X1 n=1 Tax=Drosophila persimilis TaxID=7234 RepID=UPI000F089D98|nr:E3 ubiquitin-protein ligase MARCH4 isoform X1 [Drosophila persimilis]